MLKWQLLLRPAFPNDDLFTGVYLTVENQYTVIDLLRHGECEGGAIFRGSGTDVPLSEHGWVQMADSVEGVNWDRVISSPLIRCQHFAKKQAKKMNIPLEINPDLREIHFGNWEGQLIADVWQQNPDLMAGYFKDPQCFTPEGGEPVAQVKQRLKIIWAEIINAHQGQKVLLVQHGGTIRLLLTLILNLPIPAMNQFEVPYASLTRIKVFHQGDEHYPVLVSHNEKGFRQ